MVIGTVERAFQLAPECRTIAEIRSKLVREGAPMSMRTFRAAQPPTQETPSNGTLRSHRFGWTQAVEAAKSPTPSPTKPTITAFESSPDRGRGLARDMRVRWALEEVGQPYDVRLVSFAEMKQQGTPGAKSVRSDPDLSKRAMFALFRVRLDHSPPRGDASRPPARRARRPRTRDHLDVRRVELGRAAHRRMVGLPDPRKGQEPGMPSACRCWSSASVTRLQQLSAHLGDNEWLDGEFSAGDLLMITILRRAEQSGIIEEYPERPISYVERGKARPAYQRAFQAQLDVFESTQPAP